MIKPVNSSEGFSTQKGTVPGFGTVPFCVGKRYEGRGKRGREKKKGLPLTSETAPLRFSLFTFSLQPSAFRLQPFLLLLALLPALPFLLPHRLLLVHLQPSALISPNPVNNMRPLFTRRLLGAGVLQAIDSHGQGGDLGMLVKMLPGQVAAQAAEPGSSFT